MKKILLCLSAVILILSGCKNASGGDTEYPVLLETKTEGTRKYTIELTKAIKLGLSIEGLTFVLSDSETKKRTGYTVAKFSNEYGNEMYKVFATVFSPNQITEDFYNLYKMMLGTESISLSNPVYETGKDGDLYYYIMTGGLSYWDLQRLKTATVITFSLTHKDHSERLETIQLPVSFQTFLFKYF